jgi:hypothetical protein
MADTTTVMVKNVEAIVAERKKCLDSLLTGLRGWESDWLRVLFVLQNKPGALRVCTDEHTHDGRSDALLLYGSTVRLLG